MPPIQPSHAGWVFLAINQFLAPRLRRLPAPMTLILWSAEPTLAVCDASFSPTAMPKLVLQGRDYVTVLLLLEYQLCSLTGPIEIDSIV